MLDIEDVTIVVLTHELAHAVSHVGTDSDDERWETEAFEEAHVDIKEGIAQFYTWVVASNVREVPLSKCYEMLLTIQDGPYRRHLEWIEVAKDADGLKEAVRGALRDARHGKLASGDDFTHAISAGVRSVKNDSTGQHSS